MDMHVVLFISESCLTNNWSLVPFSQQLRLPSINTAVDVMLHQLAALKEQEMLAADSKDCRTSNKVHLPFQLSKVVVSSEPKLQAPQPASVQETQSFPTNVPLLTKPRLVKPSANRRAKSRSVVHLNTSGRCAVRSSWTRKTHLSPRVPTLTHARDKTPQASSNVSRLNVPSLAPACQLLLPWRLELEDADAERAAIAYDEMLYT